MKKVILYCLVAVMLFCAVPVCAEEYDDYEDFEYEEEFLMLAPDISLASNPSTGYRWFFECDDESVVSVVENGYYADSEDLLGSGGHESFRLYGESDGFAVITFRYARSWEEEALFTIVYHTMVNEACDVQIWQIDADLL